MIHITLGWFWGPGDRSSLNIAKHKAIKGPCSVSRCFSRWCLSCKSAYSPCTTVKSLGIVGLGLIIFPGIPFPPLKQWVDLYNHHCLRKGLNHWNWVNHYFNGGGSPGFCFMSVCWHLQVRTWKFEKRKMQNDLAVSGDSWRKLRQTLRNPVQPPLGIGVFFFFFRDRWAVAVAWFSCCLIHSLCLEGVFLMIAIRIEFWIHELFFLSWWFCVFVRCSRFLPWFVVLQLRFPKINSKSGKRGSGFCSTYRAINQFSTSWLEGFWAFCWMAFCSVQVLSTYWDNIFFTVAALSQQNCDKFM